jgi:hypothetical protein
MFVVVGRLHGDVSWSRVTTKKDTLIVCLQYSKLHQCVCVCVYMYVYVCNVKSAT